MHGAGMGEAHKHQKSVCGSVLSVGSLGSRPARGLGAKLVELAQARDVAEAHTAAHTRDSCTLALDTWHSATAAVLLPGLARLRALLGHFLARALRLLPAVELVLEAAPLATHVVAVHRPQMLEPASLPRLGLQKAGRDVLAPVCLLLR